MKEILKEITKTVLLTTYACAFLIILIKIMVYGETTMLEPSPLILSIEMLTAAVALMLGIEALWKLAKRLGDRLSRQQKGKATFR